MKFTPGIMAVSRVSLAGGAALLLDEANGFGVDFTYATDANRVAVKHTLGPELVTNGGFDADASWTKGAEWTISGGVATKVAGAANNLTQLYAFVAGKQYRLTYTLVISAGSIGPYFYGGTSIAGTSQTVSGTYSQTLTSGAGNTTLMFSPHATFAGTLDNVSLKEVVSVGTTTTTEYAENNFIANAGTSPKQVYDVAGTLVWSPHNMCWRSQEFDVVTSGWAVGTRLTITANAIAAPDGTLTADKIAETAESSHHSMLYNGSVTTITGETYTLSVYAKAGERNWLSVEHTNATPGNFFDLTNGVVGNFVDTCSITAVGGGWYRCSLKFVAPAATRQPTFVTRPSNGHTATYVGTAGSGVYLWGAQLNRGAVPTAYLPTTTAARYGLALDYDPVTHAAKGLLCEPAATNLVLQNSQFTGVWGISSAAISTNTITAPDGALTADTYTVTANLNSVVYSTSALTAVAATYTHSVFVKAGTATWITLELWTGSAQNGVRLWFNLQTGALGTANAFTTGTYSSSAVQALPNGWYRIQVTGVWPASNLFFAMRVVDGNGAYNSTAINGLTFHLWGAQSETGTVATSPIPTYAASATRANDVYQATPASINYSATAGSWWMEHYQIGGVGTNPRMLVYSSAPYLFTTETTTYGINDGTLLTKGGVASPIGNVQRVAFAFQNADRAITAQGLAVAADAGSVTNFLAPGAQITFGGTGGTVMRGYIRKLFYYPRRMTNAELVTKTT